MANLIISKLTDNGIYLVESEVSTEEWIPKNDKCLKKFYRWTKKHKLKPGDIIPKRIWKKCWKKLKFKNK